MSSNICIVEFPSNLGLKEPAPGQEPGVNKLPAWLRNHGFHDLLQPQNIYTLAPPPYAMDLDEASGVRNVEQLITYAQQQVRLLTDLIPEYDFLVILGGDCSITIGNALALKQAGKFGLFYLDGHTDFMLPELSETGGAAGMDLALVTGYGHPKLTNINNQKPYIQEKHIWCVGNREYDPDYIAPILNSDITYFDLNRLRQTGLQKCAATFLEMVEQENLDGYFVHLDVDVLHDDLMPAVDSREKDGLNYSELNQLLWLLLRNKKAKGLQITILDPDLDPVAIYTKEFIQQVGTTIIKARKAFASE